MKIGERLKRLFACSNVTRIEDSNPQITDLCQEYANAFRTESYNEFWTHVLALNKGDLTTHRSVGSTTASRLPSYRLFAEHLLDPDQPTVTRILALARTRPSDISSLLRDYFSNTSDASYLCSLLLKDIDHIRKRYKTLKDQFIRDPSSSQSGSCQPKVLVKATLFVKSNPFSHSAPSMTRFRAMQTGCTSLLRELETRRDKTLSKIHRMKKIKCGSTLILTAVTTSLLIILLAHAFVLIVAAPGWFVIGFDSIGRMAKWSVQLDAAAKGTYILIRDLDTLSRLVARLNDEMVHMESLMRLWLKRGEHHQEHYDCDRIQPSEEVACRLKKNDESFIEKLDELEEHLYLCFMNINRARNLVVKETLNSGNPSLSSNSAT